MHIFRNPRAGPPTLQTAPVFLPYQLSYPTQSVTNPIWIHLLNVKLIRCWPLSTLHLSWIKFTYLLYCCILYHPTREASVASLHTCNLLSIVVVFFGRYMSDVHCMSQGRRSALSQKCGDLQMLCKPPLFQRTPHLQRRRRPSLIQTSDTSLHRTTAHRAIYYTRQVQLYPSR